MSDAKQCDECYTFSESSTPLGWYHVDLDLVTFGDSPDGWDFCSSTCLCVWAEHRVKATA